MNPGDIIPQALDFENFKLHIGGKEIIKFNEFELDSKAEFKLNYGKDGEAVSWSVQKYERTPKVTINVEELKYLINLAPGGDLLKLPPMPITAEVVVEGVGTLKFLIPAAKINSYNLKFKEGDSKSEVPIGIGIASYPIITFEG